jgi:hypothetical protein
VTTAARQPIHRAWQPRARSDVDIPCAATTLARQQSGGEHNPAGQLVSSTVRRCFSHQFAPKLHLDPLLIRQRHPPSCTDTAWLGLPLGISRCPSRCARLLASALRSRYTTARRPFGAARTWCRGRGMTPSGGRCAPDTARPRQAGVISRETGSIRSCLSTRIPTQHELLRSAKMRK